MTSKLSQIIEPFHVMEVVKRADQLAQAGKEIIHLSIGEPDFPIPAPVQLGLIEAVSQFKTRYTNALGLQELRVAIANYYMSQWQVELDPDQVIITGGASAALLYACLTLINPGDKVGITDPGYPCNKSFVQTAGGLPTFLPLSEESNFQPEAQQIQAAFQAGIKGLLLASPSNPTGTTLTKETLSQVMETCREQSGWLIMDEIYQGLVYGHPSHTLMQLTGAPTDENPFVIINSFSKYFGMTGLRLGWMVVPPGQKKAIEKFSQNLTICPNTPSQFAALKCFEQETLNICEQRREIFEQRRNLLIDGLPDAGLNLLSNPDGAFYVYLKAPYNSDLYCMELLESTGVCTVPGKDFSVSNGQDMLRISYANSSENIKKALDRIKEFNQRLS